MTHTIKQTKYLCKNNNGIMIYFSTEKLINDF